MQIAGFGCVELDSFVFEQESLEHGAFYVGAPADLPFCVDDALPGEVFGGGAHGVSYGPGGSGSAKDCGDLAVGHEASLGDSADDAVDGFVEICGIVESAGFSVGFFDGHGIDFSGWGW